MVTTANTLTNANELYYTMQLGKVFPKSLSHKVSFNLVFLRYHETETQNEICQAIVDFFNRNVYTTRYLIDLGDNDKKFKIIIYPMSSTTVSGEKWCRFTINVLAKARGSNTTFWGFTIHHLIDDKNIKINSIGITDKKIDLEFDVDLKID